MSVRYVIILVALGLLFSRAPSAHVIRVPGDQPTIQAGMDSASNGDTVLVAPGIYSGQGNRDLSFAGKDLLVVSEAGPELTVIDCQGAWDDPHRGFTVAGGVEASIRGLTIINGYVWGEGFRAGAGISSVASDLVLADCVIMHCDASTHAASGPGSGGGLSCSGGTIEATNCRFMFNECGTDVACTGSGGGANCQDTSGEFTDCEFSGNITHASGGGAAAASPNLVFQSCVFSGNSTGDDAFGAGGGFAGSAVFRDVVFSRNHSDSYGGGAYGNGIFENVVFDGNHADWAGGALSTGGATVTNSLLTGNRASEHGGAIHCTGGRFEDVVIVASHAYVNGGAICCYQGSPVFRRVTLVGNEAETAGSAVWCSSGSPVFSHVLIALNEAWGDVQTVEGTGNPIFDCSDIYGNEGGDWTGPITSQYGLNGNISEDPLFCGAEEGDFAIDAASPCAPAGNSCGSIIGALGVGCSTTSAQRSSWSGIKALYR